VTFAEQRAAGLHEVDPWGFDRGVYDLAARAGRLRWSVRVEGAVNVPPDGPALLVVNRRVGISEPMVVAMGVHEHTGRRVRPVGIPDVPVLGPFLRRLGGVLDAPAEIRGLLRAGEIVAVPCSRQPLHADMPGMLRAAAVEAALDAGAPVFPVAVRGCELGLAWNVRIGDAVRAPHDATPATMADAARAALAGLLSSPL
jgi:hypothetical protein